MPDKNRSVFVIHGRNEAARKAMFAFLRAIDLYPLEWLQLVKQTGLPNPYVGEVLKQGFEMAAAAIVLQTPDDDARLKQEFWCEADAEAEKNFAGQPRQNVIFEAGMALGISEDRTVLIELGSLRPFSDTYGRHVIRMNNSSERRQELADRLMTAGCATNTQGTEWHSTGDFEAAIAGEAHPDITPIKTTPSDAEQRAMEAILQRSSPNVKADDGRKNPPRPADLVLLGEFLWYLANPPLTMADALVKAIRGFLEQLDRCNLPMTRTAAASLVNPQISYDVRSNLVMNQTLRDLATTMVPIRSVLARELNEPT